MKKIYVLVLAVLIGACSSVKVTYDYDRNADFGKYKTYAYSEDVKNMEVGQLVLDRIVNAVDAEMAAKGFTKSESPDLLVDMHLKTATRTEAVANNTGGYYGRYGYWGGARGSTTISYNEYTDGSLFINFVDRSTEKLVWQGVGTKTLVENASPEKMDANVTYAVKSILAKYPPVQK